MRRSARRQGFTLLEVLVATTIMAVAVGTLLSALSTSVGNAVKVTDSDRAAMLAKHKLDELLAEPLTGGGAGMWDPRMTGLQGGWRARVEPFESYQTIPAAAGPLYRIVVEVWWRDGANTRSFQLDGYRRMMQSQP
jgi:general secretion pathway protein I